MERRQRNAENVCWEAFREFDTDGSGTISREAFAMVMQNEEVQAVMSKEQMGLLIEQMDRDGDGQVDFREFLALMNSFE